MSKEWKNGRCRNLLGKYSKLLNHVLLFFQEMINGFNISPFLISLHSYTDAYTANKTRNV